MIQRLRAAPARFLASCLLSGLAAALIAARAQDPLPDDLLRARTAFLKAEALDPQSPDVAQARDALEQWKRWTLVAREDQADLVVVFRASPKAAPGPLKPAQDTGFLLPLRDLSMIVEKRGTAEVLWTESTGRLGGPARLVRRLRQRMAAEEKAAKPEG